VNVLRRARRLCTLYLRCLGAQLKAVLEYQADFWILMTSSVLLNLVGFVLLWTIFRQTTTVAGWTLWEAVAVYALVFFAEGVGSLFFEGAWSLAHVVNTGELDFMLVRPLSPVAQALSGAIGINGLGNMVLGGFLLYEALVHVDVAWTPARVALAVVLLVSAVTIKVSLNLVTNASAFWIQSPFSTLALAMHQLGDMARYPITVYAAPVKLAITFAIPFAFISFCPAAAVFEKDAWRWVGLATPLVAAYSVLVAVAVFRRGLRRYESAGN
jgi:ABC-2 type transport system permease protein